MDDQVVHDWAALSILTNAPDECQPAVYLLHKKWRLLHQNITITEKLQAIKDNTKKRLCYTETANNPLLGLTHASEKFGFDCVFCQGSHILREWQLVWWTLDSENRNFKTSMSHDCTEWAKKTGTLY